MKLTTPALVVYLMAEERLPALAEAAVRGGATAIEVGIPYSDPLADGPTIQAAGQRALEAGVTPPEALRLMAEADRVVDVPLIPMTYGAIVEAFGIERFCAQAAASGAEGLICADIPPEESGPLREASEREGIDLVHLVAPTSGDERLRRAAAASRGFVYLVANVGVTGARESLDARLGDIVRRVREAADGTPVLGGFGVSRREHVEALLAAGADGAIVGSAAIEAAEEGGAPGLEALIRELAAGLRRG